MHPSSPRLKIMVSAFTILIVLAMTLPIASEEEVLRKHIP